MIDTGEAKTQAELARTLGVSRARVNQILRLLKLDEERIESLKMMGDPLSSQIVTERKLRELTFQ